jgi:predicted GH43/DUF377 family glycosyl hydrolase
MKKTLYCFLLSVILVISDNQAFGQNVWTKSPSPVLIPSLLGAWYKEVWSPSILYNSDSSRYEMWFSAGPGPELNWLPYQISFATSNDGLSWNVVDSILVLKSIPGTWEANVCNVSVLREDGLYKMWYSAFGSFNSGDSAFIAYATSTDGIIWTRYADNPVFRSGPAAWEYDSVAEPFVINTDGLYQMWYDAGPLTNSNICRIGRATSTDGIHWTKDSLNNPVLDMGGSGQWDQGAVAWPRLFSIQDTMFMCYTCIKSNGDWRRIGLARSTNGGTVWQKCGTGPILSEGSPGSWDQNFVQEGFVLAIGDTLHMWYSGMSYNTNRACIGHATMPVDTLSKYVVVGIQESDDALIPDGYSLSQNYPNPFNPSTIIEFDIPSSGFVSLKIFNVMGQEVATLINKELPPGNHKVEWKPENLSSGLYFYKLETKGYQETKKLVLMK